MVIPVLSSAFQVVKDIFSCDNTGAHIFNAVESSVDRFKGELDYADIYENCRRFTDVVKNLIQGKTIALPEFPTFQKFEFGRYQREQINSIITAVIDYKNSQYFQCHPNIGASMLNVVHGILAYLVTNDKYVYHAIDPDTYLFHITEGPLNSAIKTALEHNDLDGLLAMSQELNALSLGYKPHDRGIGGAIKTMAILRKKATT